VRATASRSSTVRGSGAIRGRCADRVSCPEDDPGPAVGSCFARSQDDHRSVINPQAGSAVPVEGSRRESDNLQGRPPKWSDRGSGL
jgi:hypothetical protein